MSSKTDTRSKLKSDGFGRKSGFFLNKNHLSNICRGPVWSFLTNLQHNEVKMLFSKRMSEVFYCGVRGDDVIAPATRSPTARNTLALSLVMEACPHWLHSRLRFTSTAVFHAADIWAARVKQKGCFVPMAGEILPQQLPFTFQRPRCRAEQVRFFKGGQWSVKAGSANHSFHQVSAP